MTRAKFKEPRVIVRTNNGAFVGDMGDITESYVKLCQYHRIQKRFSVEDLIIMADKGFDIFGEEPKKVLGHSVLKMIIIKDWTEIIECSEWAIETMDFSDN